MIIIICFLFFYIKKYYKNKKQCIKCKSKRIDRGYWIRGWNNLCSQACGDIGDRCFDCGDINWDKTLKEYKLKLPIWCDAYKNR